MSLGSNQIIAFESHNVSYATSQLICKKSSLFNDLNVKLFTMNENTAPWKQIRDNFGNIVCSRRKDVSGKFLVYDSMDNHVGTIKNKFKLFGKNSIWMEFKNKTTGKQERLEYLDLKRGDRQVIYNDRVIANISKRPDCDVTWAKTGLQNICKCILLQL
jgi:hypothetical protein